MSPNLSMITTKKSWKFKHVFWHWDNIYDCSLQVSNHDDYIRNIRFRTSCAYIVTSLHHWSRFSFFHIIILRVTISLSCYPLHCHWTPSLRNCHTLTLSRHYAGILLIAFLRMSCPLVRIFTRSSKNSRDRLSAGGSEAIDSIFSSDINDTFRGEKMFSRPRIMCLSMTWVVTFAIKVLTWTYEK